MEGKPDAATPVHLGVRRPLGEGAVDDEQEDHRHRRRDRKRDEITKVQQTTSDPLDQQVQSDSKRYEDACVAYSEEPTGEQSGRRQIQGCPRARPL